MRLEKFRVTNFRNVNDSGWIEVADSAALVGRNESGKTNLLQALRCMSGPFAEQAFSLTRDFPADRMRSEYSDELEVVRTRWQLSDEERSELAALLPRADQVTAVEVSRGYPALRRVEFCGLEETALPSERAKELVARLTEVVQFDPAGDEPAWVAALSQLGTAISREADSARSWHVDVRRALEGLDAAGRASGLSFLTEVQTTREEISQLMAQTQEGSEAAAEWVLRRLPPFLYLDEYPDIEGQIDLRAFDQRRREGLTEPEDRHFETLLRMAGIDDRALGEILDGDSETRRQIVGRAGAGLTRKLRGLWTDRPLKVRFSLDGDHLHTLVCDPTAIYDIEVNLNQRSRGFRWFFSFFVLLTASRQDPASCDAILLLDEPGLQLHAAGQRDLLRHLTEEIDSQSILATQSPFMVPSGDGASVCTVRFDEETGTTVTDDPAARALAVELQVRVSETGTGLATKPEESERGEGQAETSDPRGAESANVAAVSEEPRAESLARPAVPDELMKALFGTRPVLVVEHVSDFWYLNAVAEHFAAEGIEGLPEDLVVMPAGGAIVVPHLLSLLGERPENPILVLTRRPPATLYAALGELGAPRPQGVVFIGEGFSTPPAEPVDLEDLIDARIYDRFVCAAYRQRLEDKKLETKDSIACAVERYEDAFAALGLRFSRPKPARLCGHSARNVSALLSLGAGERFARLFEVIRTQVDALTALNIPPSGSTG